MKAPNFKITICGLNHYLSVHCVLFVLFLYPLCCCLVKFESMSYYMTHSPYYLEHLLLDACGSMVSSL